MLSGLILLASSTSFLIYSAPSTQGSTMCNGLGLGPPTSIRNLKKAPQACLHSVLKRHFPSEYSRLCQVDKRTSHHCTVYVHCVQNAVLFMGQNWVPLFHLDHTLQLTEFVFEGCTTEHLVTLQDALLGHHLTIWKKLCQGHVMIIQCFGIVIFNVSALQFL